LIASKWLASAAAAAAGGNRPALAVKHCERRAGVLSSLTRPGHVPDLGSDLPCRSDRNEARWSVALALGLRQGEALGLQWKDVDLDAGTLRLRRALQRLRGRGLVFVETKSRAGRRTIVLPSTLRRALQAHE
jgi:integrase